MGEIAAFLWFVLYCVSVVNIPAINKWSEKHSGWSFGICVLGIFILIAAGG